MLAQKEYLPTESRKAISQQLDDVLALRHFRQKGINDAQRYGGLGGIVLDGEPGIGKSELVTAVLIARGYKEVRLNSKGPLPEKPFYRMPVSMQISDKRTLLLKAFHEGAVVVVDEINSAPMMERLLNDLLMGLTSEKKRPAKPGFLIIGTQNPVTMEGRIATSTALARRLITTELPPYTKEEMQAILVTIGLHATDAASMVEAVEQNRVKAQKEQLKPAPTFRDLLRLAQRVIKAAQPPNPKIEALYQRIEALRDYGELIAQKNNTEGQKAIKLANEAGCNRPSI